MLEDYYTVKKKKPTLKQITKKLKLGKIKVIYSNADIRTDALPYVHKFVIYM